MIGGEEKSDAITGGGDGRNKNESCSFLVNFLVLWTPFSNPFK
jgi:hypothetical protein